MYKKLKITFIYIQVVMSSKNRSCSSVEYFSSSDYLFLAGDIGKLSRHIFKPFF